MVVIWPEPQYVKGLDIDYVIALQFILMMCIPETCIISHI